MISGMARGAVVATVLLLAAACSSGQAHPPGAGARSVRVLQLNLCDSGIASCYTGRAVAAAAALIRSTRPGVVTLNEACRRDVTALAGVFSGRGNHVASAFRAAGDPRTGVAVRCRNGQRYGIGLLVRTASRTPRIIGGTYPVQDGVEDRVWLCADAGAFDACTTHLSVGGSVALAQCRYFLSHAVPAVFARSGRRPVLLGADLNLGSGANPGAGACLSAGFRRVDDGGTQDVVVSGEVSVRSSRTISMRGTTDHPALLADLAVR